MMSNTDQVEFKWLDAESQGNDTVVFKLEDGALVKIRVSIDRAGVATNFRNPDGTSHYNVSSNLHVTVVPPERKYAVSKASLQPSISPKPTPVGQVA